MAECQHYIHTMLSKKLLLKAVTPNPKFYTNMRKVLVPELDPIRSSSDHVLLAQIGYKAELKSR